MMILVKHQYKDQIWYDVEEVEDAQRYERRRKNSPYLEKDTQRNSLQTNSFRGEDNRTLHRGYKK